MTEKSKFSAYGNVDLSAALRHSGAAGLGGIWNERTAPCNCMILIYGDEKNFAMMAEDPAAARQMQKPSASTAGICAAGELKATHSATTV